MMYWLGREDTESGYMHIRAPQEQYLGRDRALASGQKLDVCILCPFFTAVFSR